MKKFVFELEDVMKYREFVQSQAEIELGKAMAAEHEIQVKLDALAMQAVSVKNSMKGSTEFEAIRSANSFYTFLDTQKEFLLKKMAEAKIVSEEKRKILQEAVKKTEALHKLRERKLEEYHEAENLDEENITDDMVTAKRNAEK